MSQSVDVTPTWSGIMPALLYVLENGPEDARKPIREELTRLAAIADHAIEGRSIAMDLTADENTQVEVMPEAGLHGKFKLYVHHRGRTLVRVCKLTDAHWVDHTADAGILSGGDDDPR